MSTYLSDKQLTERVLRKVRGIVNEDVERILTAYEDGKTICSEKRAYAIRRTSHPYRGRAEPEADKLQDLTATILGYEQELRKVTTQGIRESTKLLEEIERALRPTKETSSARAASSSSHKKKSRKKKVAPASPPQ